MATPESGQIEKSPIPPNEFHLGLTMAGAVSAGAYTGGVLDYLFETLKKWEEAKKGNYNAIDPAFVPKHQVVIDVMGGASAGGMATTMAMMALLDFGNYKPVTDPEIARKSKVENKYTGNIFFDSWVHLNDIAGKKSTFEQMFDTSDLTEEVSSFFNSTPIDQIADRALITMGDKDKCIDCMPPFASKEMEMVLSLCTLRGIPVDLVFDTISNVRLNTDDLPAHRMDQHRLIAQFKLNYKEEKDKDYYLKLDPFEPLSAQLLKKITIATGAFPFGLKMRQFNELSVDYVRNITDRYLNTGEKDLKDRSWTTLMNSCKNGLFEFTAVDGGTVNNEPFGEVVGTLNARFDLKPVDQGIKQYNQFAVIMIDPFPGFGDKAAYGGNQNEIFSVVPKMYQTLRDQSLLKTGSSLNKYDVDYPRGMIFPKKNKYIFDTNGNYTGQKMPYAYPIACGSFGAFGGFLDFEFRLHDYFLGRNNCMNFLRFFFSMTYEPSELKKGNENLRHPIHRDWTDEMIEIYKTEYDGKILLPIIPDMDVVNQTQLQKDAVRRNYVVPDFPKYDAEDLFKIEDKIKARIKKIMEISIRHLSVFSKPKPTGPSNYPLSAKLIASEFPEKGSIGKMLNSLAGMTAEFFARKAVGKVLYKAIIKGILTDLDKRGLLKYSGDK